MSSSNRILLNKGLKPGLLPSLNKTHAGGFGMSGGMGDTQGVPQIDPSMRLLQGPPSMAMSAFEGGFSMNQKNLELARSKFLLDKLTGKLPPELRGKSGLLPPISETDKSRAMSRGSINALDADLIKEEKNEEDAPGAEVVQ